MEFYSTNNFSTISEMMNTQIQLRMKLLKNQLEEQEEKIYMDIMFLI